MPRPVRQVPKPKYLSTRPLQPDEVRFVHEYLLDGIPEEAAVRAGMDRTDGPRLMLRSTIKGAIQVLTVSRERRTQIYTDEVLRRWWMLATVDAREFTQVRRVCCRRCWGRNHQYQFRDPELIEAEVAHDREQAKLPASERREFNDLGGGGFDGWREPCRGPKAVKRLLSMGVDAEATADHDCPACDGMGEVTVWVNDARHYSPAAAYAYEGVRVSKDGSIEVKTKDAQEAMKMVAKHLGMLVDRSVSLELDPTKLSDEQLDTVLRQFSHLVEAGEGGPLLEHSPGGEGAEDLGEAPAE